MQSLGKVNKKKAYLRTEMICTSIYNKTYREILDLLPSLEMAEIRLDSCQLSDSEIEELFAQTDIPLIATCRTSPRPLGVQGDNSGSDSVQSWTESERRLTLAVQAGARFADLEIEAPPEFSRRFQKLCHECGTELIRSFHDFDGTPDEKGLQMALARCFRYGADIAKIVPACHGPEDARRIESLYSVVLEDVESMQGRLIAFGMGEAGRHTRIECLRRGAPFTYACLDGEEPLAPGQPATGELMRAVYGEAPGFRRSGLRMPASKSFAQRAILSAALAQGRSTLRGYTECGDSASAIELARALGAKVDIQGETLIINGIGPVTAPLGLTGVNVGESGLLARLAVPLLSALNGVPFTVEGCGTLLRRPLSEAASIMAAFGVLVSSNEEAHNRHEVRVPLTVRGSLIPGNADISGAAGSQLVSGLLMALPMCPKDSLLHVSDPKSIPYMYITLDVLRHFGISTRSEMEGDERLLEEEDWSGCTGINFRIRGGQRYRAADFELEGDWSAAANFLVAGAVFGSVEIEGLDMKSIQADLAIMDILVEAGALVSQLDDGTICVSRAPLEGFTVSLDHAPDLFPIVSVLAAFCSGRSSISGIGRLSGKESDRASAILGMLEQMGVEAEIQGDTLTVQGESRASRLVGGHLLKGGTYSSHADHRMAMALRVASLGTDSPLVIDDEDCVSKSFPGFREAFGVF